MIDSATEQGPSVPAPLFAVTETTVADEKTCNICRTPKPLAEFGRNSRWSDGLNRGCLACLAARAQAAYWNDPEKFRLKARNRKRKPTPPEHQRKYHRKWAYGITPEEYDLMFQAQTGMCKICGAPVAAVDHDHETGQIRGLLCHPCNMGLGHFRDSPELLKRALAYLTEHVAIRCAGGPAS